LDPKRSQAISIVLSRFKMEWSEIKRSILNPNTSVLNADDYEALSKYAPENSENEQISSFDGDVNLLGKPEKFILQVCIPIERYGEKLKCLVLRSLFDVRIAEVIGQISTLQDCINQIEKNGKLKTILKIVLEAGNFLNFGQKRLEGAKGIQFNDLTKLSDAKSTTQKTLNLLQFLVSELNTTQPELLTWADEVPSLLPATKLPLQFIQTNLANLKNDTAKMQNEIDASTKDKDLNFHNTFTTFGERAMSELITATKSFGECETSSTKLLGYFSVDEIKIEEFLVLIYKFSEQFKAAHAENEKQRLAAIKKIERDKKLLLEKEKREAMLKKKEESQQKIKEETQQKGKEEIII